MLSLLVWFVMITSVALACEIGLTLRLLEQFLFSAGEHGASRAAGRSI